MFSSVAEMKRELVPGTKIQMTYHRHDRAGALSLVGAVRTVTRANTVDLMIETVRPDGEVVESHMGWPKLAEVRFEENGWTILGPDGEDFMSYVVVDTP